VDDPPGPRVGTRHRQLASGTLTEPVAADVGPPELRRLAATFTATAQRLQHLLDRELGTLRR
jgi:hypothetical protein